MPWTAYKTHNINYVTIEKEVGKVEPTEKVTLLLLMK